MPATIVQAVLVSIAFGFALTLAYWVRQIERYRREPWSQVIYAFFIGAVITVLGSAGLSILLLVPLQGFGDCLPFDLTAGSFLSAILIAPFAEELMKAAGVVALASWIREVEDGVIYGASVGLGFAATKNLLNYTEALVTMCPVGLIATVAVRSLTSTCSISVPPVCRDLVWGSIMRESVTSGPGGFFFWERCPSTVSLTSPPISSSFPVTSR
ncbi:MAG: PrsW family glutamic-type intramembrane protease [Methanomicrobiales archaeon]|nr:PrsW family glutamic-type intramembrane protease [Methanomicrobiales archaeon]